MTSKGKGLAVCVRLRENTLTLIHSLIPSDRQSSDHGFEDSVG